MRTDATTWKPVFAASGLVARMAVLTISLVAVGLASPPPVHAILGRPHFSPVPAGQSQETEGWPQTPVRAPSGMVVSASGYASDVGREVLERGGNAVDAAIATGFALSVTHPAAGNIGGGGFMVIRFPDGRATAIDFREKAPLAASPEMFLDEEGEYSFDRHHNSHLAVGVPGTVAGFSMAHTRYGTGSWSDLVDPAVRLADQGFEISEGLAGGLEYLIGRAERQGYEGTIDAYSRLGVPYAAGDTIRLADLASSLARIRDEGRDGFYRGTTARLVAEEMARNGGLITEEDLARYQAVEREPIRGTYRGYDVISMPPPSSGGTALVQMLNILEGYDLRAMHHNSAEYLHHLAETMRRAYLDRARYLADTDFVDVPIERLTSKAYASELRASISDRYASRSDSVDVSLPYESPQTTHYSVVDASGMAVAVTYTLEAGYGSAIVVPGAGFLLNNEMGDFNASPGVTNSRGLIGTQPNLARPEKRMLSSMTPTIVARDGELVAVLGTPGGRTIINSGYPTGFGSKRTGSPTRRWNDWARWVTKCR
jgi:gamma-glutamyltranspeptidase/glutathione hydrolase